jgi:hypothetical protein
MGCCRQSKYARLPPLSPAAAPAPAPRKHEGEDLQLILSDSSLRFADRWRPPRGFDVEREGGGEVSILNIIPFRRDAEESYFSLLSMLLEIETWILPWRFWLDMRRNRCGFEIARRNLRCFKRRKTTTADHTSAWLGLLENEASAKKEE